MEQKTVSGEDHKRIDMTQQQLSTFAAFLIMLIFIIFNIGIFIGRRAGSEVVRAELTSDLFVDTLYQTVAIVAKAEPAQAVKSDLVCLDEHTFLTAQDPVIEAEEEVHVKHCDAFCIMFGRYVSYEDALRASLQTEGWCAAVIRRKSASISGMQREWYQLISLSFEDMKMVETTKQKLERIVKVKDSEVLKLNNEQRKMLSKERPIQ